MRRRATATILRSDLRRRWRDRTLVVRGVVAPLLLAWLMSAALGGSDRGDIRIGIQDLDGSAASTALVDGVEDATEGGGDGLEMEVVDSGRDAAQVVSSDDGPVTVIVVPEGFGDSLATPDPEPLVLVADGDARFLTDVARSVADGLAAQVDRQRLATLVAAVDEPGTLMSAGTVAIQRRGPGGDDLSPASYLAPSMAVFFLYFTMGSAAAGTVEDRRTGVQLRFRASPVGPGDVLVGKITAVGLTGLAATVVVWIASTLLMGANWGPPLGVLAVIVATVFAVGGLTLLVAALARTDRQVDNGVGILGFVMALLGGTFFSPANLPPALAVVSLLTPNGLAQRGFTELSLGGATFGDLWWVFLGLALWAVVPGVWAVTMLRRRWRR